jgi:anti-sigma regulatory factor (Ser/Thr protein kinase)
MTGDSEPVPAGPGDHGTPSAGSLSVDQGFDGGSLYALRAAVAAHASAAGLSPHRVYDVTAVAHELAANAVVHGAGRGRLRLWTQDGFLYCQVTDDGPPGPGDGTGKPADDASPWPAEHGHGLWLVGQIASQHRIDRGPAGTTVTARFALRPDTDR